MRIRGLWQVAALAAAVCAPAAQAAADETFTLDNGLRVTLRSVPKAEQTAVLVLFDIGGLHDPEGQSGLAHLVEHCYITAAAGEFPATNVQEVRAAYTAWQAMTGDDYTVIATIVPAAKAREELQRHAARMGALKVTPADLQREVPRLVEELENMYRNNTFLAARNHARLRTHPLAAGQRHGGIRAEVEAITAEQCQARWASVYKPANAQLIVAGADAEELKELVTKSFGAIAKGTVVDAPRERSAPVLGKTETIALTSDNPKATSIACVAVPSVPGSDRLYGAWCVAVGRLFAQERGQKKGPGRVKVLYAPLDDPGALYAFTAVQAGESGDAACGRIAQYLKATLAQPVTGFDRSMSKTQFGPSLGTRESPSPHLPASLYAAAFRTSRLARLGIDSQQTVKRINGTTTPVLAEMVKGFLARDRQARIIVSLKN